MSRSVCRAWLAHLEGVDGSRAALSQWSFCAGGGMAVLNNLRTGCRPNGGVSEYRAEATTGSRNSAHYLKVRKAPIADQGCRRIGFIPKKRIILGSGVTSEPMGASTTAYELPSGSKSP